jgi:hypothetical protein
MVVTCASHQLSKVTPSADWPLEHEVVHLSFCPFWFFQEAANFCFYNFSKGMELRVLFQKVVILDHKGN